MFHFSSRIGTHIFFGKDLFHLTETATMPAAIWSGLWGATASCCVKFALDPSSAVALQSQHIVCSAEFVQGEIMNALGSAIGLEPTEQLCNWIVGGLIARGFCFVGMLVCNAYMLGFFLKGMEESGSVAGTALSTASNFICSACYGYVLWRERFTTIWWTGFCMVMLGVLLLLTGTNKSNSERQSQAKDAKQD
jgi:drug/metabolite transporter (DMT)-like permease